MKIALGFQCATYTGWGVVGINIALAMSAMPDVELVLGNNTDLRGVSPLDALRLTPCISDSLPPDGVLLTAEGNTCSGPPDDGRRHMGLMVFEDTSVLADQEKLARLRKYDWLVTASRWNHELLTAANVPNVLIPQGIDPTIWHPAPKSGRFRDRFVVFSGGKLEYRKGQDIVLAAFRQFRQSHPEALLVTAWQNRWPALACDMTLNGHIEREPETIDGQVDVEGWCADNGLPDGSYLDVGMMPNVMLAGIVRECDVAVFASRAEGGTNLMAMECMAAGVPTVVSGNTGHVDLEGGAIRVFEQTSPLQPSRFFGRIDGWGELAPEALAWYLNATRWEYTAAADTWQPPTWQHHTNQLVTLIQRGQ